MYLASRNLSTRNGPRNTSAFLPAEDDKQAVCLFLKPVVAPQRKPPSIYFSPRIGLELSHPGTTSATTLPLHPRILFLPKRYRFFTNPSLLITNGRAQTFLAILHQLTTSSGASGSQTDASLSRSISLITKTKEATAAKYLSDYNSGREGGIPLIDSFIGTKGKGASSSPATYLKMMGALVNASYLVIILVKSLLCIFYRKKPMKMLLTTDIKRRQSLLSRDIHKSSSKVA